jgi:DHA2 family multidrug resistance protein-like MFS transporter
MTLEPPVATAVPLYEQPDIYRRRWFLLGILCLSLVMIVMAVSSLNVALPSIQSDLGASSTMLQWILDSYALVFAGLLLVAGALGDRFGRKEMLLLGLLLFGVGAMVSGLAGSAAIVIVGRAIQGAGAAFVMPATLSLLTAIFPPEERAKAIATWVAFAGAGGALGPIVSGALLEEFWWGSAFLFNVPVVALTAFAIALYSPRSRDDTVTPLDPRGAVLSLVGLTSLLVGNIEGAERGWTDSLVVG